ncbi:MAG: molybdopterin-dependent oxidoreductase [Chromatiales bacterium]|jgi:DMSO reductase family type II enzyme molybdopterin subunit|nr:molybdopterin-dependent oxidoreductase [Chromatiales bacterium]
MSFTTDRRRFAQGLAAASGAALSMRYGVAAAAGDAATPAYRSFEDLLRNKWTWDRVARGTHGTNCAGTCAFNVYIRNGIVWREEQQGMYAPSGDAPDYGPRGCQKGLRHAKYMYGPQRILYPMKRVGGRGEGRWERISWEQATTEIADRFLDLATTEGPQCVTYGSGTQMSVKLASSAGLFRFANITGVTVPEFYSGVGDLPTGVYMTLGQVYTGDVMAAVYKARCVLVWMSNPAATRIPDAHFFWEARYNGTKLVAISPEFTPTAMHCNHWLNPKPGTDTALAMSMVHVILDEGLYDAAYIREQTDLPLLVRLDNGEFLREEDLTLVGRLAVRENVYYLWDEATGGIVQAPGTGLAEKPAGRERRRHGSLDLGAIRPALEGRWTVETLDGPVEVTTVFARLVERAAAHAPEKMQPVTGLAPAVVRKVARMFAAVKPAMIYTGYAACKWQHGDMLQRAMLLMVSLTGNVGVEGGGLQFGNAPRTRGVAGFAMADIGPAMRMVSSTTWDYDHGDFRALNERIYGRELADTYDRYYRASLREDWFPDYSDRGWKMAFFAGENAASWRAGNNQWRKEAFDRLRTIVVLAPDMGVTALHADYVLPIAHHYERADVMLQSRIPYVQVLDAAVPPLGESVDDWEANRRLAEAISRRARERGLGAVRDEVDGRSVRRDYARTLDWYTMGGRIRSAKDVVQYVLNTTPGVPKVSFAELASRGIVRVDHSDSTLWEHAGSPYHNDVVESVRNKRPYETFTGRQQFYIDHEWFLEFDEALPAHRDPLRIDGFPLQMLMGHARHSIHSMWRDDPLLLSLQRGEPDVYVNPGDAKARGVADGDLVRVFNPGGEFYALAHVSAGIQPGMIFSYHGWDPMQHRTRNNFSAVVTSAGLIKPTTMAGDYGHLGYRALAFAPNQTYRDFTCNFERAADQQLGRRPAAQASA